MGLNHPLSEQGGGGEHTWESAQGPTIMRLSMVMRTDVRVQGAVVQVLLEAQLDGPHKELWPHDHGKELEVIRKLLETPKWGTALPLPKTKGKSLLLMILL